MSKDLECVLLVDDDPATNFLHRLVLRGSERVRHIQDVLSVDDALEYLQKCTPGNPHDDNPTPDLILLDLNMPGTTGWQFLDRLKAAELNLNPVICILTTSENPADREKANEHPRVNDFLTKPLEAKTFEQLIERHF